MCQVKTSAILQKKLLCTCGLYGRRVFAFKVRHLSGWKLICSYSFMLLWTLLRQCLMIEHAVAYPREVFKPFCRRASSSTAIIMLVINVAQQVILDYCMAWEARTWNSQSDVEYHLWVYTLLCILDLEWNSSKIFSYSLHLKQISLSKTCSDSAMLAGLVEHLLLAWKL